VDGAAEAVAERVAVAEEGEARRGEGVAATASRAGAADEADGLCRSRERL
jgi:hypothetical protein